jgi:CxxC motif-containing protein (DUF1111 family)
MSISPRTVRRALSAIGASVLLIVVSMGQTPPPQFGDPLPGLTTAQLANFNAGLTQFEEVEDIPDGLGPVFNNVSCVSCHSVGAPGGGSTTTVTRFGRISNGVFDPLAQLGGSLMQSNGIGQIGPVDFVAEVVPPQANVVAHRRTIPLFGLGLVDAVPDSTFVALAQSEKQNSPATAGQVAIVTDVASGQMRVGKFGWKCQNATLLTFSGDAYLNEMGITTPMFPNENCPQGNCALLAFNPANTNPNDVDNSALTAFTNFMTLLAPPPRGAITSGCNQGAQIFQAIGCANCHTPTLVTGPNSIGALNRVRFQPFSDFLLHDMGSLGDGIAQSAATTTQMRTAPLWGLRLFTTFLHDGRATTVSDAILAHDGQAERARNQFANLNKNERTQLLAFLNSL